MNGSEQESFDFLKHEEVLRLNDDFRKTGIGGRMMITQGIAALPLPVVTAIVAAVRDFDDFGADNDPYGEHDMGGVQVHHHRVLWKLDYYDPTLSCGSANPADPDVTTRVLTIMLASEY